MSLDDSEVLLFVDSQGNIRASINYVQFLKYSKHFEDVIWDNPQLKEVKITSFPNYDENQIVEHLIYIIECLKMESPTLTTPVNDVTPGLRNIRGYVANLEIYLLLVLNLEIEIFITEVLDNLKGNFYVDEIPTYFRIYTDILRSSKVDIYNRIISTLMFSFEPVTPELYPIIETIISDSSVPLYDRCRLYLKIYGQNRTDQFIQSLSEKVDVITSRKIDNLTGFEYGMNSDGGNLIGITRDTIVDSILKYGEAVRIAPPNDLFYFYVTDIDFDGNINLGKAALSPSLDNSEIWNVKLRYKHLFTIDDFKQYKCDNLGIKVTEDDEMIENNQKISPLIRLDRKDYVNALEYHKTINNIQSGEEHIFGFRLLEEDTKFRQWLSNHNLLSETEKILLSKRKDFNTTWSISLRIPGDTDMLADDSLNIEDVENHLSSDGKDNNGSNYVLAFKALQEEENIYYQSQEGQVLEQLRQQSRNTFFSSSDRYGGLIIGLPFYNVISINPDTKTITISTDLFDTEQQNIYHALFLPKQLDEGLYSLSRYLYISYQPLENDLPLKLDTFTNILQPNIQHLCRNPDAKSILIQCSYNNVKRRQKIVDFKKTSDDHALSDFEVSNIPKSLIKRTFYILDPSHESIFSIDEVKNNSNPLTATSKQQILAYPYNNPKIYVTQGLWYTREYIWYNFDSHGNVVGFLRSNHDKLPPKLTFVT